MEISNIKVYGANEAFATIKNDLGISDSTLFSLGESDKKAIRKMIDSYDFSVLSNIRVSAEIYASAEWWISFLSNKRFVCIADNWNVMSLSYSKNVTMTYEDLFFLIKKYSTSDNDEWKTFIDEVEKIMYVEDLLL